MIGTQYTKIAQDDDEPSHIRQTPEAKNAVQEFVDLIEVCPTDPVTFKTKLLSFDPDPNHDAVVWFTGALEIWVIKSTNRLSSAVSILPKVAYPTSPFRFGWDLTGIWKLLPMGGALAADFTSMFNVEGNPITVYKAAFSVTRDEHDQVVGNLDFKSDTMGNYIISTPLFKMSDKPKDGATTYHYGLTK